jgi:hypothetical protein
MKIVKLDISEDKLLSGVDAIALVEMPAIEENFIAFNREKFESYTDYPQAARDNAARAVRYAEANGWGRCGTAVGKARAHQLANGEAISEETIARMAAFERHRGNSKKELGDGCGRLMWLAWGGDEGVAWAQRKLQQIREKRESLAAPGNINVFGYATEHFEICPGAIVLFEELSKLELDEATKGMVVVSAMVVDQLFELEKNVIADGVATELDVAKAFIIADSFLDIMEEVQEVVPMAVNTDWVEGHIKVITEYASGQDTMSMKFAEELIEKQMLVGPLMIPNKLIPRLDEEGEYFVYFTEDTIRKIAHKFMKDKYTDAINYEHYEEIPLESISMVESWLVEDPESDKQSVYDMKYPKGTWMGMFKVEDKVIWDDYIKTGLVRGFSVEGMFSDMMLQQSAEVK